MDGRFCLRCGLATESDERSDQHDPCLVALRLEPPRFCGNCGRRLRVQVLPDGFRATCAVHGERVFPE